MKPEQIKKCAHALGVALLCSAATACSASTLLAPVQQATGASPTSQAPISPTGQAPISVAPKLDRTPPALGLISAAEEARHDHDAQPLPTAEPKAGSLPAPIPVGGAAGLSPLLPNGLHSPMPGGVVMGYPGDTGLDIAGNRMPVYAIAAGTLDYSEHGHTLWIGPRDTAFTVRLRLDQPIPYQGRRITHVWYAHLSKLQFHQAEGATKRIRVRAGERLGVSGVGNGSPHLHLGLLLDNVVSQRWGSYLNDSEVREVIGFRKGQRLPAQKTVSKKKVSSGATARL